MDKIICLGKNYAEHAQEMKEALPEKPVLFIKPASSLCEVTDKSVVLLPWHRGVIHHECEIVFKLYKKNIIGLGLGLDLTLRELQSELKKKGHPWEMAKTFKNSAIVTSMKAQRDFQDWQNEKFSFFINDELKQQACMNDALMKANDIIHYLDPLFTLCDNDLVFTGTPKGVGPLNPGDKVKMQWGPIDVSFAMGHPQ